MDPSLSLAMGPSLSLAMNPSLSLAVDPPLSLAMDPSLSLSMDPSSFFCLQLICYSIETHGCNIFTVNSIHSLIYSCEDPYPLNNTFFPH